MVIAHTNDLHTHFLPNAAEWLPDRPEIGGFIALDAHLQALRQAHGEDGLLYLDAGDILTGTPLMEMRQHDVYGGVMLDLLEAAGCDAWTFGNHEMDRGWRNAAVLVGASAVPVLSANLHKAERPAEPAFPGLLRHKVFVRNGVRVGVIGLTTAALPHLASAEAMAPIAVEAPAAAAQRELRAMGEGVDLVVALTHLGIEADRQLAREVPELDLIVGGHSHTALQPPEQVGQTWIVQAGSYARQLGVARLTVEEGAIVAFSDELVDLHPTALPAEPSAEMVSLVESWQEQVSARYDAVLGSVTGEMRQRREGESAIGRFAAEVVRQGVGADVGVYNGSGVRAGLEPGTLRRRDLYAVFPFPNEVATFELRGDELSAVVLRGLVGELARSRGALQWSGLRYQWRLRLGAPELVRLDVGGLPVDPDRRYVVATNSFVAEHAQTQLGLALPTFVRHELLVLDAAEAVARQGPIVPVERPSGIRVE